MTRPPQRSMLRRLAWCVGDPGWWVQCVKGLTDRDFAAKVRRRILFDRNPVFVTLVDKYAVRAFAEARGVAMARLLHVGETSHSLPLDDLPDDCFVKASHGSGWNIRRAGGRFLLFGDGSRGSADGRSGRELTREECTEWCEAWLRRKWHRREWAYQRVRPRIVIEEALVPREGDELRDYRFYTFGGAVKAVSIGSPSYRRRGENVFLDRDGSVIDTGPDAVRLPDPLPEKPRAFDAMCAAAETLGAGIDFVRVDLYDTMEGVRLGEVTVYPESGYRGTPTHGLAFNRWLGRQWTAGRTRCRA